MGRGDKKEKKKEEKPVKKAVGIPKYQHFPKASLAPYPDEEGVPLWLGDKESLRDLLSAEAVLNRSSNKNAEMMARPGMALSLAAATFEHGGKDLVKGTAKKAIAEAASFFTDGPGKTLLAASRVLNLGKSGTASRSDIKAAVHDYVKAMQKEDSGMQSTLVALVASTGRLYLLGMHLLEQKAFFAKLGGWAKKWRRAGQEPPALRSWLKEPSNNSKLEAALVDLIAEKAKGNKQKNREDSSGSRASASSSKSKQKRSSSAASAASRSDSEAKRKRKNDKKEKRHRSKSKKAKKEKKDKRRRSSSSSKPKHAKKEPRGKSRRRRSRSSASRGAKAAKASRSPPPKKASPEKSARKPRSKSPIESVKGCASELGFGASDEESATSLAPPSEGEVLIQWDTSDADMVSNDVAAGIANLDCKAKRLSHSAIVGLLDNIPDGVLKIAGLFKAKQDLKQLSKLPRKDKVESLLQKLDTLCAKRQSLGGEDSASAKATVSIHRVGAVSDNGHAAIKEDDPVDKVTMDAKATVDDALTAFFKAQGSSEDRQNWKVKSLDEDHLLRDVDETTCVTECSHIALLRKGG